MTAILPTAETTSPSASATSVGIRAALCLALPTSPAAPHITRRAVRCLLRSAGREDLTDDACTVASELVSNAIEHGVGPVQLRLRLRGPSLRICVRDACTRRWPRICGDLDDWEAERGRGLVMLSVLTRGWRARAVTGGKEVTAWL